ncbi:MAG: metallophosphoesterase [Cyanobacteria bacterium RYN_339]|nr:metallophosphoesterase [Cyanobacteria bacterium RYN_339]
MMRTLVHVSDVHFGHLDHATLAPLVGSARAAQPSLVVVSGDLTQRARTREFQEARAFLDELPRPQIVVPGNHDVPLFNPLARFWRPLKKFCRYITSDLEPFYADGEIAVLGLNTARSLTIKGGRLNHEQLQRTRERFAGIGPEVVKIVVTHHPFDLPESHAHEEVVGRSDEAMEVFAACGIDLFLAGHLHVIHASLTAERYAIGGHSALVVQAGTATSSRVRGEANSFNVLHVELPTIHVERHTWDPAAGVFAVTATERFRRDGSGWQPE